VTTEKQNTHELPLVGVFMLFGRGGLCLRLIAAIISIQPFAYVIGDYTCHNGENKRYENFHAQPSLPCLSGSGNIKSIAGLVIKSNTI